MDRRRRLSDPARPAHVFVFAHKPLLGIRHKDNLFGGPVIKADPGDGNGVDVASLNPAQQTALAAKQLAENHFIHALASHRGFLYFCGHDHVHHYSIVTSPDSSATVHQLIGQSASSNFYSPTEPTSANDMPIAHDFHMLGYYICSVEGPA